VKRRSRASVRYVDTVTNMKRRILTYLLPAMVVINCADDPADIPPVTKQLPIPEQVPTRPYINKDRTYYLAVFASDDGAQWQEDIESELLRLLKADFDLVSAWAPVGAERCLGEPKDGLVLGGVLVVDLDQPDESIEDYGFEPDSPVPPNYCSSLNSWYYAFETPVPQELPPRTEVVLPCEAVMCPDSIDDPDEVYYLDFHMPYTTQDQRIEACEAVLMDLVESGVPLERVWMPRHPTFCDLGGSAGTALVVEVPEANDFLLKSGFVDGPTNLQIWNCQIEDYWFYCFDPCKEMMEKATRK